MKTIAIILALSLAGLGLTGCTSKDAVLAPYLISDFDHQNYQAVMTQLHDRLDKSKSPEYTLNLLRYGSCALYAGQFDSAQNAFLKATEQLENFAPDGEFKAILTTEESKDYLGDPYEQMMAFYYVGLLDYLKGRYDLARPSLVTALLADTGSREERYRADSGLVLYLLGKSQLHLNQPKQAGQNFTDAKNLLRYHVVFEQASKAIKKAALAMGRSTDSLVELAEELYLREISANAWIHLDASVTLQQAADAAEATIQYYTKNPQKSDEPSSWRKIEPNRQKVIKLIFEMEQKAKDMLSSVDVSSRQSEYEQYAAKLDKMTQPENNLLLIIEMGKGPYKYRTGEYGSRLSYGRSSYQERVCRIQLPDGQIVESLKLDDLYYQCSTRGGRSMDDFLKGKAILKDVTKVAAMASLAAADILYDSDGQKAGNIALASGLALAALSAVTTPQADIRYWEFLPGEIHAISAQLPHGPQTITLDYLNNNNQVLSGRSQTFSVNIQANRENTYLIRSGKLIQPVTSN